MTKKITLFIKYLNYKNYIVELKIKLVNKILHFLYINIILYILEKQIFILVARIHYL